MVYHAKGQTTANGKPVALKKGDKLYAKDAITLGKGASLVLLCRNHKAFQLTKPGRYEAKSLLEQCSKNEVSYTASYLFFCSV